jgi:hypothetical protein
MKKVILFVAIAVGLASCGGWNDEKRAELKEECAKTVGNLYTKEDAAKICDCVSSKITEKFPKADFKPSDINDQKNECVKEGMYIDNLTKELQESMKGIDNTADSITKALDAAINEEMSKMNDELSKLTK